MCYRQKNSSFFFFLPKMYSLFIYLLNFFWRGGGPVCQNSAINHFAPSYSIIKVHILKGKTANLTVCVLGLVHLTEFSH